MNDSIVCEKCNYDLFMICPDGLTVCNHCGEFSSFPTHPPTVPPAIVEPAQAVDLNEIEQYRIQMAAISTTSFGYWKEHDSILPEYDTVPLRDVAKLYQKYDALYKAKPAQPGWLRAIDEALVMHDVGVANADDDYATAKDKLNKLLCVVQDIGAYFAKQESAQSELLEVVIAMRDWIDAVPHDLQLPTMPGFDRDWADAVIADAQKGKQAQSVAESVSKEWDSLGSIGNRLHNISVEQHYAGNEKLSDELGEFASLLWIWERTRKPTVPPAIPADLRSKVLELCETIIDAEDCGALVDDVMDFNLPRQIREMMGEA